MIYNILYKDLGSIIGCNCLAQSGWRLAGALVFLNKYSPSIEIRTTLSILSLFFLYSFSILSILSIPSLSSAQQSSPSHKGEVLSVDEEAQEVSEVVMPGYS
jgi:hypothetical protein